MPRYRTIDANEAVADVAYRASEAIAIYPITPASAMGEHADEWAAEGRPNVWGTVPRVVEMQSESGAAGAVHGALQAGALATTFTASQGLLLMLPDLFKIAGELSSFCMHVAARTIATHALSIFGDHSDVMAARSTGMALLASGSAAEAQDLAAIAHATTLTARVPVLHFFDGFRTSHEITNVERIDDETLRRLLDADAIRAFRARALDPEHPVVRGTSQNPDVYFQCREAVEPFYASFPERLARTMERFAALTGRVYRPFDYVGHPEAERVVVLMGSGAECLHEVVDYLVERGERVGVVKVRLFRPFSPEHFLAVLPESARAVTVLDRTKEPGCSGEPLLQEIACALALAEPRLERRLFGGRYGLASKDFTPAMGKAVFDNMAGEEPRRRFTVGIRDDVSGSSLEVDETFDVEPSDVTRALLFGRGSDGTVSASKATIKIIGEETERFAQGYFEIDSRKAGGVTVSHLRFGLRRIRSTYRIRRAHFVAVHDPELLDRRDVLAALAPGGTVLVNTPVGPTEVWASLPVEVERSILERGARLFAIDAHAIAERAGLGRRINVVMQICFFALAEVLPLEDAKRHVRRAIERTWGRRGADVVARNFAALDAALAALHEIPIPRSASGPRHRRVPALAGGTSFVERVTRLLLENRGDELPVSAFPPDGTWPTGTSRYDKPALAKDIPIWDPDLCVQCNFCSMICPHAAIQTKVYDGAALAAAPVGFRSAPETFGPALEGRRYTVQVAPEDCTGCGVCIAICPARDRKEPQRRALGRAPLRAAREAEQRAFAFFETLASAPLEGLPVDKRTAPLHLPLFAFSGACAGCGETPYLRLLTQLFGDRLLVANATGCSSIYGGNLPTTPWGKNADGRGPAWANSLFEDNAEFGFGMRLALDVRHARARAALERARLPPELVRDLLAPGSGDAWIAAQRERVRELSRRLEADEDTLRELADALVPRSVWIVGGDGWAYDIGYGGLDHVLASRANVNVLVLDTEVYSNTGGQQSKATPLGATAKFAASGKATKKKDLGLLAMTYGHVYVAQVALHARSAHTVEAFLAAERHDGPSLVIAHCPCVAHGYDLADAPLHQRRAIESGMWPLYRFDPARAEKGEPPLVLDTPKPKLDVAVYMDAEARFRMVALRDPERYRELVAAARHAVAQRRSLYEQLARIRGVPRGDGGSGI